MFSVNIDKLIKMTEEEEASYSATVEAIKEKKEDSCKTLAVIGGGVDSFKLASEFMNKGEKVLFIDGNVNADVFLGKYKLGKDLKGFTDYMKGTAASTQLVCVTNRENMDIVFTGNTDEFAVESITQDKIDSISAAFCSKYDLIVIQSDDDGVVASHCDASVIMIDKPEYSEISSAAKIKALDDKGCLILGVIIVE